MATEWENGILLSQLADEPALSEELDALPSEVAAYIRRGVGGEGPPGVVVDFGQVGFLASRNIAQLLMLRQSVSECGGRLILSSMRDEVWQVMLISGIDTFFEVARDMMTALAMLQLMREADAAPGGRAGDGDGDD